MIDDMLFLVLLAGIGLGFTYIYGGAAVAPHNEKVGRRPTLRVLRRVHCVRLIAGNSGKLAVATQLAIMPGIAAWSLLSWP